MTEKTFYGGMMSRLRFRKGRDSNLYDESARSPLPPNPVRRSPRRAAQTPPISAFTINDLRIYAESTPHAPSFLPAFPAAMVSAGFTADRSAVTSLDNARLWLGI